MASDEEVDRTARAADVARLFAQLAQERPAVLDALHALLSALCGEPGGGQSVARPPAPESSFSVAGEEPGQPAQLPAVAVATLPAAEDVDAPTSSTPSTPAEAPLDIAAVGPAPALPPTPAPPPSTRREPHDETKAESSLQALRNLFPDGFGVGAARGGLAAPVSSAGRSAVSLWDQDAAEARKLAGFARAQARRLRSIRRARHEGRAIPQSGSVLAENNIDDWLADPSLALDLEPKDLRELERWYRTAMSALLEVADWLESHPDTPLGEGYTPDALHERLQCVATAQKGVCTWFDDHVAARLPLGRQSCGVQFRIYQQLAHVWTKNFRTKLDHMRREQRVGNNARGEIDRMLARFELESAPADTKAAASTPTAAPVLVRPDQGDRFDSVADALDAAEVEFGCDHLVFTERARESAERSAFRRPDEVFDFFDVLHRIADDLRSGALEGKVLKDVFADRGFKSKPSTPATRTRYHRFYHMAFEGHEVDLSWHVTLGSRNQNTCMSIHWWHDKPNRRFVIGHCGKHLPNTLT